MKPLRAIIVDDERLARQELARQLSQQSGVILAGEAATIDEAAALLERHTPDVVFLDISMPPESGFDLLPHIPPSTRVVFVTAHADYAIRAFEEKALDYLLKPVEPARLAKTFDRLREEMALRPVDARVLLGDHGVWEKVPLDDIAVVLGDGNYTKVHTMGGGKYYMRRPMMEWQTLLEGAGFVALSRSILVNPSAFQRLEIHNRDESLLHLSGVAGTIELGRTATARARRHFAH